MKILHVVALLGLATGPIAQAQSPFDGTWRPDPQKANPKRKPEVYQLNAGMYACQSCEPPYSVKADGMDHAVAGNPSYDSVSVTAVDAHTVTRVAKKSGKPVIKATLTVSADNTALTESESLYDMGPHLIEVTARFKRAAPATAGANPLSGSWRLLETDLTHHDEDTTFRVNRGVLTMSDRMGRSFTARLDESDAPYVGDSSFTSVSLKVIDDHTLEESDKKNGQVVKVSRWTVDTDGKTIHARFDNLKGQIQHQDGHKVESSN